MFPFCKAVCQIFEGSFVSEACLGEKCAVGQFGLVFQQVLHGANSTVEAPIIMCGVGIQEGIDTNDGKISGVLTHFIIEAFFLILPR